MNKLEKKMINILTDLRENHFAECVKAEFETEGTTFEEAVKLKDIANKAGLKTAIKIGGCEAVKDLYDVKSLSADEIIAPMIETPYALKKFNNAIGKIFTEEECIEKGLYINIETITGYNNLQDIILSDDFSIISGIILGRSDMSASMNLTEKDTDSELVFNMAENMAGKMFKQNKSFTVGGNISSASIPFLSKLSYLSRYETRKIIFKGENIKNDSISAKLGIIKALDFESLWILNKRENYGIKLKEDELRLKILKKRYNVLSEISGGV